MSKGNAKHMPMKWPKGLTIMFSSVTPSTCKGFVQSFRVEKLLQLGVNIETQAGKSFSLPIKSEENGKIGWKNKRENILILVA